jgi:hypothetical protein
MAYRTPALRDGGARRDQKAEGGMRAMTGRTTRGTLRELALAAGWLALLGPAQACAGAPAPTERLTTAEAAIRGAKEIDAQNLPRGALHLKLAREQVELAKRYIADDRNEGADLALLRAQADAELAIALAREHEMKEKAKTAHARLERLKAGRSP